jgi:hypothetical protein
MGGPSYGCGRRDIRADQYNFLIFNCLSTQLPFRNRRIVSRSNSNRGTQMSDTCQVPQYLLSHLHAIGTPLFQVAYHRNVQCNYRPVATYIHSHGITCLPPQNETQCFNDSNLYPATHSYRYETFKSTFAQADAITTNQTTFRFYFLSSPTTLRHLSH